MNNDMLVDTKSAARIIAMSIGWLNAARLKGTGPRFVRVGAKAVRYRVSDLEAWLAANTIEPKSSVA